MELFKEILVKVLENEEVNIEFPSMEMNVEKIIGMECYKALQKIQSIIENNDLDDFG